MNFNYNILNNELKNHNIDLSVKEIENRLFQLGHEVEETFIYENDNLVVGKILTVEKHPNADKLNVCTVDIKTEIVQIVCGAPNVEVDAYVIVAKVGCKLPEITITESNIRDVKSQGMMCSLNEIGISNKDLTDDDISGIFIFDEEHELGSDALDAIGFKSTIYDVSLTANRGDCLNYNGMTRDLMAVCNVSFNPDVEQFSGTLNNKYTSVINDGAYSFHTLNINVDKITTSPIKLRTFLIQHNIKPQNLIVDLANLTMIQTGIPIHTYDGAKLDGNFIIETIKDEEVFIGLDEVERKLSKNTLVVKDQKKICAVASVMGSNETKITDATKEIVIEIGHFDPILVRKSGNNFSNKTDALMRGEKGLDPKALNLAFNQYVKNLETFANCNYEIGHINSTEKISYEQKYMNLDFSEIEIVLGITLDEQLCLNILNNLGFVKTDKGFVVPSWRQDIENDHDLIEEISRVYNLENIHTFETTRTFIPNKSVIKSNKAKIERNLEQVLLKNNLNQVLTYSLISEDEASMFGVDKSKLLTVLQPQSKQREYYRGSLIKSLIDVHNYNYARNITTSNIFEIANTYYNVDDSSVGEELIVSGLVSGVNYSNLNEIKSYTFYDLKNITEVISKFFDVEFEYRPYSKDSNELNKYATAEIYYNNKYIGLIGQVYPTLCKTDTFVFELNITEFLNDNKKIRSYQKLFTEPTITRDLTIDVDKKELAANTYKIFDDINYLVEYQLKDIYYNPNNLTKSLTFTVSFNDNEVKLTNSEIDKEVDKIISNIKEQDYGFKN